MNPVATSKNYLAHLERDHSKSSTAVVVAQRLKKLMARQSERTLPALPEAVPAPTLRAVLTVLPELQPHRFAPRKCRLDILTHQDIEQIASDTANMKKRNDEALAQGIKKGPFALSAKRGPPARAAAAQGPGSVSEHARDAAANPQDQSHQ